MDAQLTTDCLENPDACNCRFCSLFDLFGRKWTLHLLGYLRRAGPLRFNELQRRLDGISPRTLSDRLTELESMGLVDRVDHEEVPPRVDYRLTDRGRDLERVYEAFVEWAEVWDVEPVEGVEDLAEAGDRDGT